MPFATRRIVSAASRGLRPGAPALGLLLLLGGCASFPGAETVDGMWSSLTGPRNDVVADSLTVQRVRGQAPGVAPLLPEAGNVWPEQEAPRPTLLSGPEEAMRNIPEYRPQLIEGAPPARSPVPTPGVSAPPVRRGSGAALQSPGAPAPLPRAAAVPAPMPAPPPRPAEGQVMVAPNGPPAVVTGQAGRITGVTQPGLGGGAVIRDGNVETWIGPDGRTYSRVVTP